MNEVRPQTFKALRRTDVTGVSGAGHIADGVVFNDGTTVLRWRTETNSTAVYSSFEDMVKIHGHDGATVFQYDNPPATGGYVTGMGKSDLLDALRVQWRMDFRESTDFKNAVMKVLYEEMQRASYTRWLGVVN